MNFLRYRLTKEDVKKGNKWVSRVLQNTYAEIRYSDPLFVDITWYTSKLLRSGVDEDKLNELVYERVELLKEKFPDRFPPEGTLGWYEKNRLCELFLEGKVVVDGLRYEEILARQEEEIRIRDAAREQKRKEVEEEANRVAEEGARLLAEKEAKRKEVVVGMLFRRKDGLVRAFIEAYPKKTAVSRIAKELPSLVEVEWVNYVVNGIKRKVWEVKGVKEVGRAWEEDLVEVELFDAVVDELLEL